MIAALLAIVINASIAGAQAQDLCGCGAGPAGLPPRGDVIFEGLVLDTTPITGTDAVVMVQFEVRRGWRGVESASVTLHALVGDRCAVSLQPGVSYLVGADIATPLHACDYVRRTDEAIGHLEALGPPAVSFGQTVQSQAGPHGGGCATCGVGMPLRRREPVGWSAAACAMLLWRLGMRRRRLRQRLIC